MKKNKYQFKVSTVEIPLGAGFTVGDATIKVKGGEYKASELLARCMEGSEKTRSIVSRALGRYARAHPEWWQTFRNVTDMQLSDPPLR